MQYLVLDMFQDDGPLTLDCVDIGYYETREATLASITCRCLRRHRIEDDPL